MTAAEAATRHDAALQRLVVASPVSVLVYTAGRIALSFLRAIVHLCVGFGVASAASIPAWWGIPAALMSALTLGKAWSWWHRDARVLRLEAMADEVERQAAAKVPK